MHAPYGFVYRIMLPKSTVWEPHRAHQFMEQMLFAYDRLVFRIVATYQCIEWQIVDLERRDPSALENAIRTSYPEAQVQIEALDMQPTYTVPFHRYVIKYQYALPMFVAPIQYVTELTGPDPLAALTQAMSDLQAGERIIYTLIVVGFADYAYKEGEKLITVNVRDGSLLSLLFPDQQPRYAEPLQRVLMAKLQTRLSQTSLFIQIDTPDPARFGSLFVVDNHMVDFDRAEFNGLRWIDDNPETQMVEVTSATADFDTSALGLLRTLSSGTQLPQTMQRLRQAARLVLAAHELASLWHLPHQGCTAATIHWSRPQVRLPIEMHRPHEGICLGVNEYAGKQTPVWLPQADRSGHISIIGKAGVGKSNLLHHLIHQDIANNRGVAVIDPHGALITDILRTSIPEGRAGDVVILDIANEDFPPPLNPLAIPAGAEQGNAAGQLMAVVQKFYEGFEGRMADTLWGALVTLMQDEMPTIRDVPRLFRDRAYRAKLTATLDNVMAEDFWADFEAQSAPQQEQFSYPVTQRMRTFYGSKALYPILCHPDALDFASLIAQNKILLVSLKADEVCIPAREQHLLGSVLVSQLQMAVLGRKTGSTPYYLYIDEMQHFVTTSLKDMLSEARKFGLSLILANQYLKQLTGDTLDAIMGNIGAQVVFQCGLEDARALVPYMSPGFDTEALINFDKYEAAVKLRYTDKTQAAFSLKTLAPLVPEDDLKQAIQREQHIRQLSIERYTPKSRAEVMAWLEQRYPKANGERGSVSDYDA